MLKDTKPFLSLYVDHSYGIPYTTEAIATTVYDQLLWSIKLLPGTSNTTYAISATEASDGTIKPDDITLGFKISPKTSNTLIFGVSSDPLVLINSVSSIYSLNIVPSDTTYNIEYTSGDSLSVLVGIGCLANNILPNSYNIAKLKASSTGVAPMPIQFSGSTLSTLGAGDYKAWRLSFSPKDRDIAPVTLSFTNATGLSEEFNNIRLKSTGDYHLYDATIANNFKYTSANIVTLNFTSKPNPYPYCWQKKLPDLTYITVIPELATSTSTVVAGPLAVGASLTSNMVFRNTTDNAIVVTEISVANITQSIASLSNVTPNFAKNKVAGDFTVSYVKPDNSVVTFPTLTGSALTSVMNVGAITLNSLDELVFTITYSPKLKIVPTLAMLSPTPNNLGVLASIINLNRKLSVQVKGYLSATPGSVIPLGNAMVIKGALS